MFEIKNIKDMPQQQPWLRQKYPIKELEVGDGFAAPLIDGDTMQAMRNRLSNVAFVNGEKLGRKFSVRKVDNVLWVIRTA